MCVVCICTTMHYMRAGLHGDAPYTEASCVPVLLMAATIALRRGAFLEEEIEHIVRAIQCLAPSVTTSDLTGPDPTPSP